MLFRACAQSIKVSLPEGSKLLRCIWNGRCFHIAIFSFDSFFFQLNL